MKIVSFNSLCLAIPTYCPDVTYWFLWWLGSFLHKIKKFFSFINNFEGSGLHKLNTYWKHKHWFKYTLRVMTLLPWIYIYIYNFFSPFRFILNFKIQQDEFKSMIFFVLMLCISEKVHWLLEELSSPLSKAKQKDKPETSKHSLTLFGTCFLLAFWPWRYMIIHL